METAKIELDARSVEQLRSQIIASMQFGVLPWSLLFGMIAVAAGLAKQTESVWVEPLIVGCAFAAFRFWHRVVVSNRARSLAESIVSGAS